MRRFAAAHVANPTDAVHNGHIMAMARVHFEEIRVFFTRRFIAHRPLKTDCNRVCRVEAYYPMVFYINGGDPVSRSRDEKGFIKTNFKGAWFDINVPVKSASRAQAEVPLPYNTWSCSWRALTRKAMYCVLVR